MKSRLKILRELGKVNYKLYLECLCICGNKKRVRADHIKNKKILSCGCLNRELVKVATTTHGMSDSRLYRVWKNMKNRVNNTSVPNYKRYGAKGITIDQEWYVFETFMEWALLNGYTEKLTLDRIDNSAGYSPANCRWATYQEQSNNSSNPTWITHGGETYSISEWGRRNGLSQSLISWRLKRGWDIERSLTKKVC